MSFPTATVIALGLYAGILTPLALAFFKPRTLIPVLLFYCAVLGAVVAYQWRAVDPPPDFVIQGASSVSAAASRRTPSAAECSQAIQMASEANIIKREGRGRVLLDRNLWPRLPQEARDALVQCLQSLHPRGQPPLELIEQ